MWGVKSQEGVRIPAGGLPGWVALSGGYGWAGLAGQAAFYGLAWLGGRSNRGSSRRSSRWARVFYLPTFLVQSNFAAVVGLYRYLTRQQTSLWNRVQRRAAPDLGGAEK